jgi:hypothetical protein
LKKNTPYTWDDKTEKAFVTLKITLTTECLLQYPNFARPFVLTTDASNDAIGAVLSQGTKGNDAPIGYTSRTLNDAERNYPIVEKELLAMVWGCKYFKQYLLGRKFTIVTDHRPLTWIFSVKDPTSRLLRWRLKLEECEYEVIYKRAPVTLTRISLVEYMTQRTTVTVKQII